MSRHGSQGRPTSMEADAVAERRRWCAETGHFRSVLATRDGGTPREHTGRYFVLWRLEADGIWRIDRYVDGIGGRP